MRSDDLTPELERELVRRYQSGDRDAATTLWDAYRPLLWRLIGKSVSRAKSDKDAEQNAALGFFTALARSSAPDGCREGPYACRCALGYVVSGDYADSTIRVSRDMLRKARAAVKDGGELTPRMASALRLVSSTSIDAPVSEDNDAVTLRDLLVDDEPGPESCLMSREADERRCVLAQAALDALTPRERDIVNRFDMANEPETLTDIGRSHGVTREAIRQAREKALGKMSRAVRRAANEDDAALWGGKRRQSQRAESAQAEAA